MSSATTPTKSNRVEDELASARKKRVKRNDGPQGIPCISIKPFIEGDEAEKKKVAKEWDRACQEVGFITIVDHGVPADVIEKMWEQTTGFFNRPLAEKNDVTMTDDYPYGYVAQGMENLEASLSGESKSKPGDAKEMFNMCLGVGTAADPGLPKPQWPAKGGAEFKAAWQSYYAALTSLAETLYRVCAAALDLPEDWFVDKITRHRNVVRAINYPEQPTAPLPGQLRASTHTDYGSLTILRLGGEHSGGLQAMGVTGEWVDVDTKGQDAFVINLGDLMAQWTNDRWMSTPHRVINPPDELLAKARRQSVAFFCNINMDAQIKCIPTCEADGAKYAPTTAGEHLMRKHSATVAGKLCYEKSK